ncbi:methyltransferase [Skermanella mucosa]|uniref:tRNA1(Val) (adenine(37)-N6)-methyltransferase n=1 Tax=Skermanella mucosa TaxID=1789672 RepID=UPI00192CC85D|nr:methyltransferase [Skermanella mucosa]UEM21698.1 methyltransferase [Skermanella mucosa]
MPPADNPVPHRTADRLLGGRVLLMQPARGYRAAIDPVLLAAATPASAGERVLDVGAGVGAATLCLASRVPGADVTGLELQPDLAALGAENIRANGLEDRVRILEGDLLAPPEGIAATAFDRVMTNPPFQEAGTHTPPPDGSRALAHGEGAADLAAWLDFCARRVKPRGTLTVIHRADRLDDLIALLHGRFGAITLVPLWPKAGRPARRILVTARKGARSPARLMPGLVLHEADGRFTGAAEAILRDGAALDL